LEVLLITRSIRNTFAPINRVPPDVLSLIPDYRETDEELIKLTHVCRSWRDIFISRASLWTFLDCKDLDKTSVYIQRSRKSPLEVRINRDYLEILLLVAPHVGRLKALTLSFVGRVWDIRRLIEYFSSTAPLLEKLAINVYGTPISKSNRSLFGSTFLGGNLSSLRELRFNDFRTDLPWKNMSNLTLFEFRRSGPKTSITQLLDFFEQAPLLREIKIFYSFPLSSDAPAERVVSLPHLKLLRISEQAPHSMLLNHLHIPAGASATLEFEFGYEGFPIPDHLPSSLDNLGNIAHITSINLDFNLGPALRLKGPSGNLYMVGVSHYLHPMLDSRTLRFLPKFPISSTESLTIARYATSAGSNTEESAAYQTLLTMNDLRTLTLVNCINLSFILALDPNHNASNTVLCPKLEKLLLYNIRGRQDESFVDELLEMAKARASMGVRLSTIGMVCGRELISKEKVPDLRNYVGNFEYKSDRVTPKWDLIPGDSDESGYDSNWD